MGREELVTTFSVVISKEGKFYVARCPELSVTSQGNSFEGAKANLREAIELYIESFGVEDLPRSNEAPIWTSLDIAINA
jgi:predicted RNase H-like HicB family nuclease